MEQDAIIEAIIELSMEIEEIGCHFSSKELQPLVEKCGGTLLGSTHVGCLYKVPIVEGYAIILSRQWKYLKVDMGVKKQEKEYSIETSAKAKLEIFRSHGNTTLQKLAQLRNNLKSTETFTRYQQDREKREQLKKERFLRRIAGREKTTAGQQREFVGKNEERLTKIEMFAHEEIVSPEPPKKVGITEEEASFYKSSEINIMYLANSSNPVIKEWTQELHSFRKNIGDKDVYARQLKDFHSKVSRYHSTKCKGKSPMDCVWKCDIWQLLHLCLYLMGENSKT